jgi:hypothetical protein
MQQAEAKAASVGIKLSSMTLTSRMTGDGRHSEK